MSIARRRGLEVEFKATEKSALTHSMTVAQKELGLAAVDAVHPGEPRQSRPFGRIPQGT